MNPEEEVQRVDDATCNQQAPPPPAAGPAEESSGIPRARPRRGTSLPWLLALFSLVLLPSALSGWLVWHQLEELDEELGRFSSRLQESAARLAPMRESQRKSFRQMAESYNALRERLHQLESEAALEQVSAQLANLLSGKDAAQLPNDTGLGKALEQLPPALELVLLLDAEGNIVRASSKLEAADREALRQELKKADKNRWRIWQPPDAPVRVAARLAPAATIQLPEFTEAAPDPALPDAAELLAVTGNAKKLAALILPAVLLAAAVLALAVYLAWRRRLWKPLRQLADCAGELLEAGKMKEPLAAGSAGPAAELFLSLQRMGERLQLLEQMQEQQKKRTEDLGRMEEALRRAAAGDLGVRLPLPEGELQLLALANNRLLDSLAGSLESLARTAVRGASLAEMLQRAGAALAHQAPEEGETPPDNSALADMISLSLESLYRLSLEETRVPEPPGDLEPEAMTALAEGVAALGKLAAELAEETRQMGELERLALLLSTQLSVVRDSGSPLEEPRRHARLLVQEAESLRGQLQEKTQQLLQLAEVLGKMSSPCASAWQELVRFSRQASAGGGQLAERQKHIVRQMESLLPSCRALAVSFRRLAQSAEERGRRLREQREALSHVCQAAEQLGALALALSEEIRRLGAPTAAPLLVSQELAHSRQALERVMRAMEEAARHEGISALAPETADMIDNIRDMAEQARQRVTRLVGGDSGGAAG